MTFYFMPPFVLVRLKTKLISQKVDQLMNQDCTVVGDNINIMKTTFELNFDLYQAFKQHVNTKVWKRRKAVN